MKSIKYLLTSLLLLCSMVVHAGVKVEIDGIEYSEIYGLQQKLCVTEIKSENHNQGDGHVVIPETIPIGYGQVPYAVHSIAIVEDPNLVSITIPKTVVEIYPTAFNGCTSLKDVYLGCFWNGGPLPQFNENVTVHIEPHGENEEVCSGCNLPLSPITGYCGESGGDFNVKYTFDASNRTLTIFGSGRTRDWPEYPSWYESPGWYEYGHAINTLIIEEGVEYIGNYAFSKCNIQKVISHASVAPTLGTGCISGEKLSIEYPEGSDYTLFSKYCDVPNSKYFEVDGTEWYINDSLSCAYACGTGELSIDVYGSLQGIKTIEFKGDFTSISRPRYQEPLDSLETVIFPKTLTTIGDYAFYDCPKLKNVFLPKSLITIGDYAFAETSIDFIVIPQNVTTIGNNAFCPSYIDETGEWVEPVLVFKSFVAPHFGDFDSNMRVYVPEGANSYPSSIFSSVEIYYSQREYATDYSGKVFVFGNADNAYFNNEELEVIESMVFAPDATGYNLITVLPNLKHVDVLETPMEDRFLYSVAGSNAIYVYKEELPDEKILIAGCAATVIPEGTTIIDNYAFYNCSELKSINIPNSVKEIGYEVFVGCENMRDIHINSLASWCNINFNSYPLEQAQNLYLNGELITDLVIPDNVTNINSRAFYGGKRFVSLKLPNSIQQIGEEAFKSCKGLTSVEIPSSVTNLGIRIFENCDGLKSVTIHNPKVEYEQFRNCLSLEQITIGKDVTSINSCAFELCDSLQSITIDTGNSVFEKRENSNAIVETSTNKLVFICKNEPIPSTVTALGENCFVAYRNLDVTIPAQVTSFAPGAMNGLCITRFTSEEPAAISGNIFGWGAIYVPKSAYEAYCNAPIWKEYKDRMVTVDMAEKYVEVEATEGMSGVLDAIGLNELDRVVKLKVKGSINSYDIIVFRDKMPLLAHLDLSEATVVESVKPFYKDNTEIYYRTGENSLGGYAFSGLKKLTHLKLPKDLIELGKYAVSSCSNLMVVDGTAAGELYIGESAFEYSNIPELIFPAKIREIGQSAFWGCAMRKLELSNITGDIGVSSFSGCSVPFVYIKRLGGKIKEFAFKESGIKSLCIDTIVGDIETNAFSHCSDLKDIRVGVMMGDLCSRAFEYCKDITRVEFKGGPKSIGEGVFAYSDNVEYFAAGEGLLFVNYKAFCQYKKVPVLSFINYTEWKEVIKPREKLSHVVLPNSVTSIGSEAFKECTSLTELNIPQNLEYVGESAFEGCIKLSGDLHFSHAMAGIFDNAFRNCHLLESVTFADAAGVIGDNAFQGCSSLKSVTFADGLNKIGSGAFSGCNQLQRLTFPNSLTSIGNEAFKSCSSLTDVKFSDNLTSIGASAFSDCNLSKLNLPPSLKTIESNAFTNCRNLTELHIPSAVENIGWSAFSGCHQLNDIYTYTIEPTKISVTTFSTFTTATLHVPMTSFWNYYWDIGWSQFNHKFFKDFNEPYKYFYLNNDYYLNGNTGYIEGTPDADMRPGSGLIVESDKDAADDQQNLGDVTIGSDGNGNSGVIIGDENLHIDNLHVKINVKKGRWYFFAFPWDVPFKKISMQKGSDYVFRYYDGEERAKNGNGGWKNVNENHLKAARGYIFQSSGDDVLMIAIEDVKFKKEDKYNDLVTHVSDNINDASWNLMGNPYLSYYDMSAMDYSAPVTVWDGEKYVAIRPGDDDYQFSPYEAFFVQKPEGTESVGFTAEDQMTKTQSETLKAQQTKARLARKVDVQRLLVNLVLEQDSVTDRTRVVFNNRQKMAYETACDAAKFETEGVPQLYTLDDDGVRYAINERPMNDGIVRIGFTASQSGEYTLDVARMDTEVVLYDAEMNVVHDFKNGAYAFYSDKGTFEDRFTLGVPNNETTGVEEVELEQVVEVIEGGIAFSADATVTIYNAAGVAVAKQQGAGTVMLQPGVYVVSVGNKNLKVVVK